MLCQLASIGLVIDRLMVSGLWYLSISHPSDWQDNNALWSAKSQDNLTSQLIVSRFYHEFTEEISQQVEDIWILQQQSEAVPQWDGSQREVHPRPAGSQAEARDLPELQELLRVGVLQAGPPGNSLTLETDHWSLISIS